MHFLVLSRKHALFPLAHWLAQEGQPVTCASMKVPYAKRAWRGIATKVMSRRLDQRLENWLPQLGLKLEETILITDCISTTNQAQSLPFLGLYGSLYTSKEATHSGLRVAGWWDGAKLCSSHWLFIDWGLHPTGQGPTLEGGWVAVAGQPPAVPAPDLGTFRGYLQIDLMWDEEAKGWRTGTARAGWSHAALAVLQAQEKVVPMLLQGEYTLPPFLVALRVSVPPFPHTASQLQPTALAAVPQVPMDIQRSEAKGLVSANLDGMLGLCTGRGKSLEHARSLALSNAQSLQAAQATWRLDVGAQVPAALSRLETLGWY